MLSNFLFNVAGLQKNFQIEDRLNNCVNHLRDVAGQRKVLVGAYMCGGLALMLFTLSAFSTLKGYWDNTEMNWFLLLQFLLSGGVDSTVCAALAIKALKPEQICAVHINNGFMRKNESEMTVDALEKLGLKGEFSISVFGFRFNLSTPAVRSIARQNPIPSPHVRAGHYVVGSSDRSCTEVAEPDKTCTCFSIQ